MTAAFQADGHRTLVSNGNASGITELCTAQIICAEGGRHLQQNTITVGEATYTVRRQFSTGRDLSQLIIDQLVRKDLPPDNRSHKIDTAAAPQV